MLLTALMIKTFLLLDKGHTFPKSVMGSRMDSLRCTTICWRIMRSHCNLWSRVPWSSSASWWHSAFIETLWQYGETQRYPGGLLHSLSSLLCLITSRTRLGKSTSYQYSWGFFCCYLSCSTWFLSASQLDRRSVVYLQV